MSDDLHDIEIIVWYATEAHYLAAKAVMEDDVSDWHETYAEWRDAAELGMAKCWAKGQTTACVNLDPEVFVPWCRGLQRKVDDRSRADYVAFLVEESRGAAGGDVVRVVNHPRGRA